MEKFDHIFDARKAKIKAKLDTDLNAEDLKAIIADYKKLVQKETGKPFPQDPREQLSMSRDAVFRTWWTPEGRSTTGRMEKIPDDIGTAANVQAMVFGNMGDTSGTGVGFTRDPSTGEKVFYGEFLVNAQGEDVVAGIRTPQPIAELEKVMPEAFAQLREITTNLEKHYNDMQDFEFTIEEGKLYMLQTRNGKRTGPAAVRIAVDMVEEGLITKKEAVHARGARPARSAAASGARSEDAEGSGEADHRHFRLRLARRWDAWRSLRKMRSRWRRTVR